jgi:hypothetical protein
MIMMKHGLPMVVLLIFTVPVFELLRRIRGSPDFRDIRGWILMGLCAMAITAVLLLISAFLFHQWPFYG